LQSEESRWTTTFITLCITSIQNKHRKFRDADSGRIAKQTGRRKIGSRFSDDENMKRKEELDVYSNVGGVRKNWKE